jgi:protein TonB
MGNTSLRNVTPHQEVPSQKGRWIASAGMTIAAVLVAGLLTNLMAVDPPAIPNKGPISPYTNIFLPKPPEPPKRAAAKKVEVPSHEPSFPTKANDGIKPEVDKPAPEEPGDDTGVVDGDGDKKIEPEPPPPPKPEPPQVPVRVGGNIRVPVKTRDVRPSYPPIAQSARVQGIVIVEATIGADGLVKDAKVLRSIPLLDEAALAAVRQWQFTPTFLNNVPVPVIMTVTVQFTLQ